MTTNDTFERRLEAWLEKDSAQRVPDHLDRVLVQTIATGQRPGWSSLERWLPMTTTTRGRVAAPPSILWFALLAAVLMAVVGVAVVGGALEGPAPTLGLADNGRIYVADGNTLVSYAADGSDRRPIADLPDGAAGVAISPNGRLLAHHAPAPDRVEIVELATGRSRIVPLPGTLGAGDQIAWSPTSDRIVFPSFDGNAEHVMIAPVDGGPASILGDGVIDPGLGIWWPSWSPQGDTIAFVAVDKRARTSAIQLIDPDGTDLRTLTTPNLGEQPGAVTWSPDDTVRRLLYTRDAGGLQAYLHDLETGTDTFVADTFWPTWSPDGSHISVWGTKVATTEEVLAGAPSWDPVTPSWVSGTCQEHPDFAAASFCGPAGWSPDGTRLIAPDVTGDSILSVPIDGIGEPFVIELETNVSEAASPVAWQPMR